MCNSRIAENILICAPKIDITLRALRKVQLYIEGCPVEISGLGTVEVCSAGHLVVTDVFIVDQMGSASNTLLSPEALAELVTSQACKGLDLLLLRCWWHSHAEGAVFFSRTDENTIDTFTGDFLVSVVGNRRGDLRCRLDLFLPVRLSLEVPLCCTEEEELRSSVEQDIARCVHRTAIRPRVYLKSLGWLRDGREAVT